MTFCPNCSRRLSSRKIDQRERMLCESSSGGCGFIDFGFFTLGVGGIVLDTDSAKQGKILLIQRNQEPNRGSWTIPGGFVEAEETAEVSVVRELEEETGLHCSVVGLVGFRNRVDPGVNTSYAVFLLNRTGGEIRQGSTPEIAQVRFFGLPELENLAALTPLSKEVAVAALTQRLRVLQPVPISGRRHRPHFTLFLGEGSQG